MTSSVDRVPLGSQPRGADGSVDRPYSALNLRLGLAIFGLLTSLGLAVALIWLGYPVAAIGMFVLAGIALADVVVIQLRRRRRRGEEHSLFE